MKSSFNLAFALDKWLSLPSSTSLIENASLFEAMGSSLALSVSGRLKIKVCVH